EVSLIAVQRTTGETGMLSYPSGHIGQAFLGVVQDDRRGGQQSEQRQTRLSTRGGMDPGVGIGGHSQNHCSLTVVVLSLMIVTLRCDCFKRRKAEIGRSTAARSCPGGNCRGKRAVSRRRSWSQRRQCSASLSDSCRDDPLCHGADVSGG